MAANNTKPELLVNLKESIVFRRNQKTDELVPTNVNCDIAARLVSEQNRYVYTIENKKTYYYFSGVYQEYGDFLIKKLLQGYYQDFKDPQGESLVTTGIQNEIIRKVQNINMRPMSIFQSTEPIFNVENGVLNLETRELEPPSPDRYILNRSPVVYDPDAECPGWFEFLDSSLDKLHHETLQEMFGYTLWPDYHAHYAFMLYGAPRAGKGVTNAVLESMIGLHDCSHVSLQNITGHRFMPAELYGKKVNTYADLPSTMIVDPGVFKAACGGDALTVEKKNQQPYTMYNKAKLIFSANRLPKLAGKAEDQGAFYSRWIVIPYEHSFLGSEDTTLKERLTTPKELSGVLNWSLKGLDRIRASGWKFTTNIDSGRFYRRTSNPLVAFLEDEYESSDEEYVLKSDLVVAYNDYAKKNKFPPAASKIAFGKDMINQTVIPVANGYRYQKDKQVECWIGIKKKDS